MTMNEELLDLEVRHQVQLQRLSAGTIKRLIKLLDQADADIVAQLQKRTATLEGSFTSERLQMLLRAIREINHDAHVQLGSEIRQELRDIARYEVEFQAGLLTRTIPVAFDVVTPAANLLDAVITARPFQGRLLRDWVKDLSVGTMKRLQTAIQLGMIEGETVEQIIRRVRGTKAANYRDGVMETTRRQAGNLVRTAVNHVSNAAREKLFEQNDDIVAKVQWVATLDTRTCPVCMALDGKTFPISQGKRPPAHPSCRCATIPVLKSLRQLGIPADDVPPSTRASMDGQVPSTESFQQWLKRQSAERQDEALGPTRGRLFRQGGLTVDAFSDVRGNELTLAQLRAREVEAFAKAGLAA